MFLIKYPRGYNERAITEAWFLPGMVQVMTLRDFIKKQRKIHRLTQADLARKAGVGLRFIRELEQNKSTLRIDKVNQVLQLFGKTLGPVDLRPKFEVNEPNEK